MDIRVFRPPTWEDSRFLPVATVSSRETAVRYTDKFFGVGDFELRVPAGKSADALKKHLFVFINKSFWGMIKEINRTHDDSGDWLTASGICLDGLTHSRVTMPPNFTFAEVGGTAGFDTVRGSTETCMKHFIHSNFFTPTSPARHVPGFHVAADLMRGNPDDMYMSRFEQLSDVIYELGRTAEIGYSILPDLTTGRIVFDVVDGADRSAGQSDNPRIVFDIKRRNIADITYTDSDRNMKNLFYASLSGSQFADETYTATVTRDDYLPSGLERWEHHLDISATHPQPGQEIALLRQLALIRAESHVSVESFDSTIISHPKVYGVDYKLGDIVTVQNREWGIVKHTRLTAMTVEGNESGITYTATFGEAPINFVDRLRRQIRGG